MPLGLDAVLGAGAMPAMNLWMNERNNQAQIGMAQGQMEFQREMSNTAHQREVEDLKKAGLNPVLSAGGNGASTPSGAQASLNPSQIDLPAILSVAQMAQNQQKLEMEEKNNVVNRAKTVAETGLTPAKLEELSSKIQHTKADTKLKQKGTVRAEVEGEAAGIIHDVIKKAKDKFNNSNPPNTEANKLKEDGWLKKTYDWLHNSTNPDN